MTSRRMEVGNAGSMKILLSIGIFMQLSNAAKLFFTCGEALLYLRRSPLLQLLLLLLLLLLSSAHSTRSQANGAFLQLPFWICFLSCGFMAAKHSQPKPCKSLVLHRPTCFFSFGGGAAPLLGDPLLVLDAFETLSGGSPRLLW